jgi:hypothetical protein
MRLRGVNYEVGRDLDFFQVQPSSEATVVHMQDRPVFDPQVVQRELQIIRNDLHCNAVRIAGQDIGRLTTAATDALEQGLEVWLSPQLFDRSQPETFDYTLMCATAAEMVRRQYPRLVLVLGSELTIFMQGLLEGGNFFERISGPSFRQAILSGAHNKPLNAFLGRAAEATRQAFHGPITYASAPLEAVDWQLFDFVCVDHYRDGRIRDSYGERLKRYFVHNKPVVVTEFGCCTYQGAENAGGMGWAILDPSEGTRPQLNGDYVRDEALQAREVGDMLQVIDSAGVEGAFVHTFVSPTLTHDENPRLDLDMASYALVKSYAAGHGTTYPEMPWEPKRAFKVVAESFQAGAG